MQMACTRHSNGFRLLSRQLQPRATFHRTFTTSQARTQQQQQPPQQQPHQQQQQPQSPPSNDQRSTAGRTVDFGFETIAESLKQSRVGAVFSSVASSYDTMNDLMSLGIHRLWKDQFVRGLNPGAPAPLSPQQGWNILDVAGGTGDIAFRMLDNATNMHGDLKTKVTVADINTEMLAEGRKRSLQTAYARSPRLDFIEANAEHLDMIPSNSIDLYTVAFGIRNFTDKPAALREAFRVLKPGGVFACLEFSKVNSELFDALYRRWSFTAIPIIGQLVAGDRDSYQYLVESIARFPKQPEFRDMIRQAGFSTPGGDANKGWEDLTGGIAAIHKGVKPLDA